MANSENYPHPCNFLEKPFQRKCLLSLAENLTQLNEVSERIPINIFKLLSGLIVGALIREL